MLNWQEIGHDLRFPDNPYPQKPPLMARAKIPGGWLFVFFDPTSGTGGTGAGGMTFVPDRNHDWDGNSVP